MERADEIARELGYKDAAEQLQMNKEETNARMDDDEMRTKSAMEIRLREEIEIAEKKQEVNDMDETNEFDDPLFDFDVQDAYTARMTQMG